MDPPSVRKLKQAQLPFFLNKCSPVGSKTSKADKENSSIRSNCNESKKKVSSYQEKIVDLTNSDGSQDEDKLDADKKSSKKRRRRTASPTMSNPKRHVPSDQVLQPSGKQIASADANGLSSKVPKILITPATPMGSKSRATDFFTSQNITKVSEENKTDTTIDAELPQKTMKPAVVESMDAERGKGHGKERHKYPPLSSILGRKRSRSKSPPGNADTAIGRVREEKNKKMDVASTDSSKSLYHEGTETVVVISSDNSNIQDIGDEKSKIVVESTVVLAGSNDTGGTHSLPDNDEITLSPEKIEPRCSSDDERTLNQISDSNQYEKVKKENYQAEDDGTLHKSPTLKQQEDTKEVDDQATDEGALNKNPSLNQYDTNKANDQAEDESALHKTPTKEENDFAESDSVNISNLTVNAIIPDEETNVNESDDVSPSIKDDESSPSDDEVYTFDKKLAGDAVVVVEDNGEDLLASQRRKSARNKKKVKVDKSSPQDESKTKNKSRRSIEAERRKQDKEKEKQERKKQRDEQKLAKEKEKIELQKRKEEEKTRKEEERRKKREEEEAAKADRLRLKEEEKQKKREEEEAAKAEKLRKLEERKREKERLELEKKMEKEKKEEEKKKEKEKREEEKRQRELERLQIEKEKQQAEEEKRKKNEKRAEAFKSFFKSPDKSPAAKKSADMVGKFVPFQLKKDMFLAPIQRNTLTYASRASFEKSLNSKDAVSDYLVEVFKRPRVNFGPTFPRTRKEYISLEEDGLELVEDLNPDAQVLRAKFLSFHANYRPPYYGTWRKKSKILSYRNPFKKDNDIFDYEFDSDDEWEEPADGEDIDHSDGEDEGEGNEEDEDDGFFVPHGYLSDDEGIGEEGEELGVTPDHKLKQKQLEFEASFKRKLSTLTPIVIGCVWKDSAASLDKVHQEILDSYKPEFMCKLPISVTSQRTSAENEESPTDLSKSERSKSKSRFSVPDEAMPDLVRLLHGNPLSISRIVTEFQAYWKLKITGIATDFGPISLDENIEENTDEECSERQASIETSTSSRNEQPCIPMDVDATPKRGLSENEVSKAKVKSKCKEIAIYTRLENMNRSCWFVHDNILKDHGLGDGVAPVPCRWKYVTNVPKVQVLMFPQSGKANPPVHSSNPSTPKQDSTNSITKFASVLSPNVILESSKLKHEKEKTAQQSPAGSISKYAVEKMSPSVIIEKSVQKITEEQIHKSKETSAEKTSPAVVQDGIYVIPSKEAVRSFFKIDDKSVETTPKSK